MAGGLGRRRRAGRVAGVTGEPEVLAAGGVVWRRAGEAVEVLLVHRPKHDDWSLPKGKLNAGESLPDGALREVEEETGHRCRLGPELGSTRYLDDRGRDKRVTYWAMTVEDGSFTPNDEVDEVRWVALDEAAGALTHEHDHGVVAALRPHL